MAYSAPSRNGAGRLRKMEKRTADAVRPKIRIMIRKECLPNMKYCNPDTCSECLHIGEGDSICEISHELVLDNWQSVPHTIPQECPIRRQIIRQRRKAVRRR